MFLTIFKIIFDKKERLNKNRKGKKIGNCNYWSNFVVDRPTTNSVYHNVCICKRKKNGAERSKILFKTYGAPFSNDFH